MKYTVTLEVRGLIDVEVEANCHEEAYDLAEDAAFTADLNRMEYVEMKPIRSERLS